MKEIKIKFIGFWPEFNKEDNFIVNLLRDKFDIVFSESPDYVISSCFSDEYLYYDCIRIFYTGENICPDFNAFDYAIGFEYMEFGDRYLRFPNYCIPEIYQMDYEKMCSKHLNIKDQMHEKTDFCSFVVSKGNGYVDESRRLIFDLLSEYKKVNSGGRYLNNIGEPQGVKDKYEFQKKHKFAIAFENSSHEGYTTEKLIQAFAASTIPIYWGDPKVSEVFDSNSFINCHDFEDFHMVVEAVEKIDQDDFLYEKKLETKALLNSNMFEEKRRELLLFLDHIFSQDIKKAYRRDLVGYGKKHCDELKKINKVNKSRIMRKIISFMR